MKFSEFARCGDKTYYVGESGRVASEPNPYGFLMDLKSVTQHTDKDGYKYVTIYSEGIRKNYKVHRLVAEAFLQLKADQFVNHINGRKDDNRLENLEVCTRSENMKHAVRTGLLTNCTKKGENHNTSKHTYAEVCEIRRLYKQTKISMRGLAKRFHCSSGYISDVVNNKIRVDS